MNKNEKLFIIDQKVLNYFLDRKIDYSKFRIET